MIRWLIAVLGVLLLGGALLLWRAEPLYLAYLASRAEPQTLAERRALIADGVEVHLPAADDDGPFPAVLLFHGCAGPRMTFQRQWAEVMTEEGFAAAIIDSTGPRGFSREEALAVVCGGKTLLGQERAGDILAALEIIRDDPRIDANRLVLAGWSHGAWTVMDLLAMDLEKRRPAGLKGDLPAASDIDGVILFYPHCGVGALSKRLPWRVKPPALALIADADSIVNADACKEVIAAKIDEGAPIDLTVYPDAEHVFDDPFLEPEWIHWYDEEHHKDAEKRVRAFLRGLDF